MIRKLTVLFFLLSSICNGFYALAERPGNSVYHHYINIPEGGLPAFLRWHPMRIPLVSHHRGGPADGYPENAIETMDQALTFGPGIMEVDITQLKDGTLVLLHDKTLERTTTGTGAAANVDWPYVSKLFLRDWNATETAFRVPLLKEALLWAKGRAILTLDIKRGASFTKITEVVRETQSQDYVVAIAYTLKQAQAFHRIAPELVISVTIRNDTELRAVKNSGIPARQLVVWTGNGMPNPELFEKIHKEGWRVIMGTLGPTDRSLDAKYARTGNDRAYLDLFLQGADIVATDRPEVVHRQIRAPNMFLFYQQKVAR